jgi:hypothetical protein
MERLAQAFVETVEDSCERMQVAGSVRRKKPRPSDIEIVVGPAIGVVQADQLGLLGEVVKSEHKVNLFDLKCDRLLDRGILEKRQKSNGRTSWGEKAKLGIAYLDGEWAPYGGSVLRGAGHPLLATGGTDGAEAQAIPGQVTKLRGAKRPGHCPVPLVLGLRARASSTGC